MKWSFLREKGIERRCLCNVVTGVGIEREPANGWFCQRIPLTGLHEDR